MQKCATPVTQLDLCFASRACDLQTVSQFSNRESVAQNPGAAARGKIRGRGVCEVADEVVIATIFRI